MSMRVIRFNVSPCTRCGGALTGHLQTEAGTTPEPGDVSICGHCGKLHVFTETLDIREPTDEELASIRQEAQKRLDNEA